MNKHYTIAGS